MFRFLIPILGLSAVAYGGVLPEAFSDDSLPEALSDDWLPKENSDDEIIDTWTASNVYPDVIDSNVFPEGLEELLSQSEDLLSEEDSNLGRIVGGDATAIASVPWQLFMRRNAAFICGAVLISPNWALSAAHCTYGRNASNFLLFGGTSTLSYGVQTRSVSRIINHPSYNPTAYDNDICLMEAASAFGLTSTVRPADLPAQGAVFNTGTYGVISGWGPTSEGGSSSNSLRSARVPVFDHATCRSNYGGTLVTDNMICAGYARGITDACSGDYGGPFVIGSQLAGIASWGRGCARPNLPTVFTRVAVYRNWIRTNAGV